ncbi:MAG: flagellar filament capping protein FliD [Candidatus Latescibacteria bacterium]|nr:flagellar filament capping protein FliD [Candidatus Latescibacterota bacterium]
MANGITFSGLGSGLDTESIIKQLTDIERRPIQLNASKQSKLQEQKEIFRGINTGLLSLKSTVDKLADGKLFSIVKAQSSDTERVGVQATTDAAAGTFNVEVLALAQARSLSSRSFGSLSSGLGLSGEFVINGKSIAIAAEDDLTDVRQAINEADAGVTAQILSVTPKDNRLILTAKAVGADGFDVKDASAGDVLQSLGFTSSTTRTKNAFFNGARSSRFLDATQAVGTQLGLADPPAGSVTIDGAEVAIDLATDSLEAIRDKINSAGIEGVSASVVTTSQGGITRYQLQIEGTDQFADVTGTFEALGVLDGEGAIADGVAGGGESDAFASTTTSVGALLGLAGGPTGNVSIAGQSIALDLAADSLGDIQDKINNAGISGVSASISSATGADGSTLFRLQIAGTTDFVDAGNALESLGILVGSNSNFTSVTQVLTSSATLKERGSLLDTQGQVANSAEFASSSDLVGSLNGSSAAGSVAIGDQTVAIDLAADSLETIRDRINNAAISGVSAAVTDTGAGTFKLEISGTTQFEDQGGVLAALGVMGPATAVTADTRFADLAGAGVKAGDTISIGGTNHNGEQINATFSLTSTNLKVQNLLNTIEQAYGGGVTASVDASGRIAVLDKTSGKSSLSLSLLANNEGGGALDLGSQSVTTQGLDARSAELQTGQDAKFRINGITLSRDTNTVDDAVEGVTLDLKQAAEGETISITITKDDTGDLKGNIKSFVDQFNTSMKLINDQFLLDPKTQKGGPLSGDATLLSLQSRLRGLISGQVNGLTGKFDSLVMVGVAFDRDGKLNVDDDKLDAALTEDLDAVRRLFVSEGSTTDQKLEFISSNKKSKPGSYAVKVTRAPEQALVQGGIELGEGLAQDQTLTIIDKSSGRKAHVHLAAGDSLSKVVDKINENLDSEVAEVRRGTAGNTTDGTTPITAATAFSQIFGAGAVAGDTIRINGTTHEGSSVSTVFTITDPATQTVGDLLSEVRTTFGGGVSVAVDAEGKIAVTDGQVGDSKLTLTLIEDNQGGGSLDLGSIEEEEDGRPRIEITAFNQDGKLALRHDSYGSRNGFSISQSIDQLGLATGDYAGIDAAGTINNEKTDGFGRILTGAIGEEHVEGVSVRVGLTPEDLAEGGADHGQVKLVHGVARLLADDLSFITDTFTGTLKNRVQSIDDTLKDLDAQTASLERRVEVSRQGLVSKFAALEGSLSSLQSQGSFLSQQLSSLR